MKVKDKKQLLEDFEGLSHLSMIVITLGVLVYLPLADKNILLKNFSNVYDMFVKIGLKHPALFKYLFYGMLILFAIYLIKLIFDLIIKLISYVQQLKGGAEENDRIYN